MISYLVLQDFLTQLIESWFFLPVLLIISIHFSTRYLSIFLRPKKDAADEATRDEIERLQKIYKIIKRKRRTGHFDFRRGDIHQNPPENIGVLIGQDTIVNNFYN